MIEYFYTISGKPYPMSRPRFNRRNGAVWNSQQTHLNDAKMELSLQHGSRALLNGPIHVDVTFYMRIPVYKKKVKEGDPHHIKPDIDNLLKFCLDSANTVIYHDDASIQSICARKIYSDNPRTEIKVKGECEKL